MFGVVLERISRDLGHSSYDDGRRRFAVDGQAPRRGHPRGQGPRPVRLRPAAPVAAGGRVLGHVTVVVDLGFAKQTLAFNVSSDIQAAAKAKEARLAAKDAASEAAADPAGPVVFPPASVASMVKDVKRLTAAVSAHNLDAALQSATATRCFMAGKTLFLVTVSIDPHALASAQANRPSLIRGKTVRLADELEQSQGGGGQSKSDEEAAQDRQDKIMEQLKSSGIMVKKHQRKGSPERACSFTATLLHCQEGAGKGEPPHKRMGRRRPERV